MKSTVLSTSLALCLGAFSSLIQAQTCELEAVVTLETSLWGNEVSFTISDDNGILASGQGAADYTSFETTFCLDNVSGCLVLEMIDSFGDGWNGAILDVSLPALGIPLGTFTLAEGNYQAITFGEGCENDDTLVEGCTDPNAFNYDPTATVDDGSCSYDCICAEIYAPVCGYDQLTGEYVTYSNECEAACAQAFIVWDGDCTNQPDYGCTDPEATNYDPEATDDDGSCIVILECEANQTQVLVTLQTDIWGNEVSFSISNDNGILLTGEGLGDYTAFSSYFCLDDDSGCLVLEMFDSFGDGWNGAVLDITLPELGISLGTFTLAEGNYQAITFGEGCENDGTLVEGCTDPNAFNYDPTASVDDGSCSYDCICDDVYDPVCGYDYVTGEYVTFNNECEAWCAQSYIVWYGDCADQPVYGCTNDEAINYNPDATQDDGSCVVIPTCGEGESAVVIETQGGDSLIDLGLWYSLYWNLTDAQGAHVDLVYDYSQFELSTAYGCLQDGCYNFFLYDYGWANGEGSVNVTIAGETVNYSLDMNVFEDAFAIGVNAEGCEVFIPVYGCTDIEAVNYNPEATSDDGSCVVIPTCGEGESALTIQVNGNDSLADLGFYYSVYWSLTDAYGLHVDLVYDYSQYEMAAAYGCLADGCYNFFLYDYGWEPGMASVDVTIGDNTTTYEVGPNQFEAAFAIGVNTEGCEVTIPVYGCTDSGAMNYNPDANTEDGSCLYPCECPEVYDPVCGYDYFTGDYVTFNNACEAECWNAWIVWDGDCADQPIYGCTNPEALNYNPDATDDDGSCALIPVCGEDETEIVLQTMGGDSLNDLGIFVSLYWNLTTELGQYVELVYDYDEVSTTAYGCLADGCYNFYLYDYGWQPGYGSVDMTLNGEVTSYQVPSDQYDAVFALGINSEGCEVTIPGCTDPEALNYYAMATIDDGSCQYPFICETGIEAYVYLYAVSETFGLDIVDDAGNVVYSQQDVPNYYGLYDEICLDASTCYTAILTGSGLDSLGWNEGSFGISTAFADVVYAEWPATEGTWELQFSLDGSCGEGIGTLYGCTDPNALNFNPIALVDDGSCIYDDFCDGLVEVLFVLDGGLMPDEVGLNVSNDNGDLLMEMDGYTGSSQGCVPAGCYTVEMLDSNGDGWNGAVAEVFINGESAGTMALEEGNSETRVIGIGMECETPDNGGDNDNTTNVNEIAKVSFQLFPNPGQDQVRLKGQGFNPAAPLNINVFNADGRLVEQLFNAVPSGLNVWTLDASDWNAGLYIIHVTHGEVTTQHHWVKMR